MSKSEGNGFTPLELISGDHPMLKRGYSPMTIRFFMLQAHYSSTLDFSNEALEAAEKGYKRLIRAMNALEGLQAAKNPDTEISKSIKEKLNAIHKHLSDDFNSPLALAKIFEICNQINQWSVEGKGISSIAEKDLDSLKKELAALVRNVLGLEEEKDFNTETLSKVMNLLMEIRKDSKLKKDFGTSDKIRDDLNKIGIKLKDMSNGETSYLID